MKFVKDIVCILLCALLEIVFLAVWFLFFALGYILQGTWAGVACFAMNAIIGIAFVRITKDKESEVNRIEDK